MDSAQSFRAVDEELSRSHAIGDTIPYPSEHRYLLVGNGSPEFYGLASVGVDKFGRLWRQDEDGFTMIADFSANVVPKG